MATKGKGKIFIGRRWKHEYFHLKACGRKKKNHIAVLRNNGVEILGDEKLIQHVTEYYEGLFGQSSRHDLRLGWKEQD